MTIRGLSRSLSWTMSQFSNSASSKILNCTWSSIWVPVCSWYTLHHRWCNTRSDGCRRKNFSNKGLITEITTCQIAAAVDRNNLTTRQVNPNCRGPARSLLKRRWELTYSDPNLIFWHDFNFWIKIKNKSNKG